jgi:RNA polymerase sigma-70 factor (ECF subfamily)
MNTDMECQFKKGDNAACESLYKEFGKRLYKSAIFLTNSREEAEDIIQETFSRIFASIHRFQGRSSLYTWAYRIFLNVNHDLIRRKYVHKKFLNWYKPEENIDPIADLVKDLDNDKLAVSLGEILKNQKMKHREIIVLRFYQDLKLNEVAEILQVGIGTVKSRLHHALKQVKKSIGNIEHFRNKND